MKGEFLSGGRKQKFQLFYENIEKRVSAIKLSMESPVLLNSSQIFSEGLKVIAINKVKSFC